MSPNTNRSPSAVPARLTRSSGSPTIRPWVKFSAVLIAPDAFSTAESTLAMSAGASETLRSRASSTKLFARSASSAARAASISRVAASVLKLRASLRSASAPGRPAPPKASQPRSPAEPAPVPQFRRCRRQSSEAACAQGRRASVQPVAWGYASKGSLVARLALSRMLQFSGVFQGLKVAAPGQNARRRIGLRHPAAGG